MVDAVLTLRFGKYGNNVPYRMRQHPGSYGPVPPADLVPRSRYSGN